MDDKIIKKGIELKGQRKRRKEVSIRQRNVKRIVKIGHKD